MRTTQKIISIVCIIGAVMQVYAAIQIILSYLIMAVVAIGVAMIAWPEKVTDERRRAPNFDERVYNRTSRNIE